jgi:hypothetical protein
MLKRSTNPLFGINVFNRDELHAAQDAAMRSHIDASEILWSDFKDFLPAAMDRPAFLLLCRMGRAPSYWRKGLQSSAPIWDCGEIFRFVRDNCPQVNFFALKDSWAKAKRQQRQAKRSTSNDKADAATKAGTS